MARGLGRGEDGPPAERTVMNPSALLGVRAQSGGAPGLIDEGQGRLQPRATCAAAELSNDPGRRLERRLGRINRQTVCRWRMLCCDSRSGCQLLPELHTDQGMARLKGPSVCPPHPSSGVVFDRSLRVAAGDRDH